MADNSKTITGLGPKVIGAERYEREQRIKKSGEKILGPRVLGERLGDDKGKGKQGTLITSGTSEEVIQRVGKLEGTDELLSVRVIEKRGEMREDVLRAIDERIGQIESARREAAKRAEVGGFEQRPGHKPATKPQLAGAKKVGEKRPEKAGEGPLGGVVEEVKAHVAKVASVSDLEALDAEEKKGQGRKGVSEAIERRIAEIEEQGKGEEEEEDATGGDGYLSVEDLEAALENNPDTLDSYIDAEFAREGGVRKGAIRALLATEHAREGGPRAEVVEQLEAEL